MPSRPFYETWRKLETPIVEESVKLYLVDKNICPECNSQINKGDWPFCKGNKDNHVPNVRFGFDPLEPYVDEHLPNGTDVGTNYAGEKVTGHFIASRSDRQRIMKEQGVVSGGKSQHRSSRAKIDYDSMAENIAKSAYKDWKQR